MNDEPKCPHCGEGPLYQKKGVQSGTPLAPSLVPGLGGFSGNLDVVICQSCGFIQLFLSRFQRKALARKKEWKRVGTGQGESVADR